MNQSTLEEVVRRVAGDDKGLLSITLCEDKVTKSFRGMAFVNFQTTEDASAALGQLGKMVINERKVFAEYRRVKAGERERKPHHEKRVKKFDEHPSRQTFERDIPIGKDENGNSIDKRTAFFAMRDTVRKADELKRAEERAEKERERETLFRNLLLEYGEGGMEQDGSAKDLVFDASLTSYERKLVHQICSELGLGHISRFDESGSRVLYVTKDPQRTVEWELESKEARAEARKQALEQRRKTKENVEWKKQEPTNGGPLTKAEKDRINWFKPRSAKKESEEGDGVHGTGIRAPSYKVYIPPHKPTGPDGTIGFESRAKSNTNLDGDTVGDGIPESGDMKHDDGVQAIGKAESKATEKSNSDSGKDKTGKGTHRVLNPSVPAFSPSFAPSC